MTLGADDTTPEILPVSGVERVVRLVTLAGAGVAAFMVLIVFSMVSYSVFMRYVLGTPVTFTD